MKVEIDREEFADALKRAKEATEKKSALPILTNFLISAEEDKLIIKATDLENYLTIFLKAKVEENGTACVSSKSLINIVKNLTTATINLELEGERLLLRGGRSQFKLPTVPVEDFPEFPEAEEGTEVIRGNLFIEGVERTEYAISKEDTNVALQGMYLRGYEGKIHFVGSDGHRLALYEPEGELSVLYTKLFAGRGKDFKDIVMLLKSGKVNEVLADRLVKKFIPDLLDGYELMKEYAKTFDDEELERIFREGKK